LLAVSGKSVNFFRRRQTKRKQKKGKNHGIVYEKQEGNGKTDYLNTNI